ncbi:hypothetical protein SAMN04488105_114156 [Salipiger thiooxidans]|uniref:Uncharacterized protein n=1 Tax=Salipiger thiooxidans TaxID=282683 RepID=A0A1G7J8R2_9RHOB|nr:hypothetical protein [Salipiger thiooxidans]SDF21362.1 hypothetical protein SAMN04488105_114156 [Salipiger thiooxidans]
MTFSGLGILCVSLAFNFLGHGPRQAINADGATEPYAQELIAASLDYERAV